MNSAKDVSVLVSELSKLKPNLVLVKSICEKTGFQYSDDLIQLMSDILMNIDTSKKNSSSNLKLKQNNIKNQNKNNDQARI
jgi:hypothetical protein